MAIDIDFFTVPVFTDVNNTPIEPTATNAGNGSHLIKKHNDLVESVAFEIDTLNEYVQGVDSLTKGNWVVVNDSYTASPGEKIVVNINNDSVSRPSYDLILPTNPPVGSFITYLSTTVAKVIDIKNYNKINSNSFYTRVFTDDQFVVRTLVYLDDTQGWSTITGFNYQFTIQSN